jgi:hypothetical protein
MRMERVRPSPLLSPASGRRVLGATPIAVRPPGLAPVKERLHSCDLAVLDGPDRVVTTVNFYAASPSDVVLMDASDNAPTHLGDSPRP